ncbi:cytochrome P450 [Actinomadura barringtoniae]|uniref:Cytochrome P450 n=1 Tax=Actinomadura barringtoniae TaxID=1427535 RepID=A0A939PAX1_9ACTN|nr:cytochrome P450 [Actinomadura barringtoniae]MBO2445924.1 cytochrome P450 [Actinomadura barringtoniae]
MTEAIRHPPLIGADQEGDPHPRYARAREEGAVVKRSLPDGTPIWCVTRYSGALQALGHPDLSQRSEYAAEVFRASGRREPTLRRGILARNMLASDPPDHTRLRRMVSQAFTARRISGMRDQVQRFADELADGIAVHDETDLIASFAFPMPVMVICELLGVPFGDRDRLRRWSQLLTSFPVTDLERAEVEQAVADFGDYLGALISDRRRRPDDQLLSALIAAGDEIDGLADDELVAMAVLLVIAGHETTVGLIGNGLQALLRRPDQFARLRDDDTRLAPAIEEFLRLDGPVSPGIARFSKREVEIDGTTIPAGQFVFVMAPAANRDPARFEHPDDLDMTRGDGRHLAFGHGPHYCLGAPLARLEGEIAIGTLIRRFPRMRLAVPAESLRWRAKSVFRVLHELPVKLT